MAETKKILQRSEIAAEDKWALEDIYATEELWNEDLERFKAMIPEAASFAGRLSQCPKCLLKYMQFLEKVSVLTSNLANYISRRADEDVRIAKYQGMLGKMMSTAVEFQAAASFDVPEILSISEETLADFFAKEPELERYRRYLQDIRRRKEHVLSPEMEKLLASAGEMASAPETIFSVFSDGEIKYPDAVDSQGNHHPLSHGTYISYMESADRTLRKSAFEQLYHTYGSYRNTLASVLFAQVKQLQFFAQARNYPSALDASLDVTNVPTSVYRNLIEAVHQNMDKMYRYTALRKKLLGVDELHMYDLYTPLVAGADRHIPFQQAKDTVYQALAPLGEEYRAILKEGFENRWIDVYENEGKRSGAYSAGESVHPYVLLNYSGTLDSQFTLAHEMGHALHSYYSQHHQAPLDAGYVIFVAEVASTCNEALLMQYLLKTTTDKRQRAYLINYFLEQFRTTLYRQTMFAEFELAVNQMTERGEGLTADTLCDIYRKLNADYFGPDIVVDEEISLEWARIPHFYYNYYVYQYSTGYAAAIALSQKILQEGKPAVEHYLNFLKGGSSKPPIDLLRGAGVDMATAQPIDEALKLFDGLLDEMDELVK